jgi:hypothetical protein
MIFNYLSSIHSIRNINNTPLAPSQFIISKPLPDIHFDLFKYTYDQGDNTTLIYENEVTLIRNLEDISNNEIRTLILTNNDWDIIIVGDNNIDNKTLQDGYKYIYKVNDNVFHSQFAYIASRRFMQKVKNNDISTINTYLYTPTFLTTVSVPSTSTQHIIGTVLLINHADTLHFNYHWSPTNIY